MGAGASTSNSASSYAASSDHEEHHESSGPPMNWEAAKHAADSYDKASAVDSTPQADLTHPDDLSVAHETVQMIFDILNENGSHMTDEESMQTVIQTAQALANHSNAAALLMSNQRDQKTGDTLLHGAVRVGELEVVQFLLTEQFSFDINAQNWKGNSPLHLSCTSGTNSAGIAEVLLEWNAWTESQNLEGATPLILAAAAGDDMCIQTLLKFHADKETRDFNGYSALDWAQHYCHLSSVEELGGGQLNQWLEYYDENSQLPYWYNTSTGESVWENPLGTDGEVATTHTWTEEEHHLPHSAEEERKENDEGETLPELNPSIKAKVESKVEGEVSATATTTSLTEKWRTISWKVGRKRIASKISPFRMSRSPSRRSVNSPAPPTTPKPLRSPLRESISGVDQHTPKTPSSLLKTKTPIISPNHGAQIHRQIEQLMQMQANMQEEMRRRLDAAAQSNSATNSNAFTTGGMAAIEEERVNELEERLRSKDEELAALRSKMSENTPSSSPSKPFSEEEHEASLLAARREVEIELKKQRETAAEAMKREKEASKKEKEAMMKVESMMEELRKKEKAVSDSRQALIDHDLDKNETKKALVQQAEQLKEAKHLAAEHQNALQQMRRQHST